MGEIPDKAFFLKTEIPDTENPHETGDVWFLTGI
jgi:hypothetical protein